MTLESDTSRWSHDDVIGTTIDRYRIESLLGEGGFGSVYLAEQTEPIRRRVAIKIIKLGMDTRQVIARFEAERQALAVMDHPSIARVLDAGATGSGRPYFVMELVEGEPITTYCDRHEATLPIRLELFAEICSAVQHAHQKGIIHRDIKPSNVLITTQDGRPVPKVIDFGIAKATDQQRTEQTVFTEQGQFIGTPEYMSPEQAGAHGHDVDTRSDVYSLGVLLYELLTGTRPFDGPSLRQAGLGEIQRVIREVDPQRPSTRLASIPKSTKGTARPSAARATDPVLTSAPTAEVTDLAGGETLLASDLTAEGSEIGEIARLRHTDPKTLGRALRGDLDWIVMKAMEKDRGRRYETANGLAADIRRYLTNEPVVASPPSATYRMRKFVRRNRAGVSTAFIAAGLLVAFAVTMAVQANRIATERDRANREREISEKIVDFQARMLRRIEPVDMGHDLVTDLRGRVIEAQGDDAGAMAVADLATFDRVLDSVSMTDAARQVIDANILAPASTAIAEQFGDDPATEARLRYAVGRTYRHLGMPAKGITEFERSYELREQVLGPDHRDTLEAWSLIGDMHNRLGRYDVAEGIFREAVERWELAFGLQDEGTLDAYLMLAVNGLGNDRDEEARDLLEMVLAEGEATDADADDIASTVSNLATAYINLRQFEEAEPLLVRALDINAGLDDPSISTVLLAKDRLARMRSYQKRHDEAIALMHEVVETGRRERGALHPGTLVDLNRLARTYERADRHQESLDVHRDSLQLQREVLGDRHPSTQTAITDVGIALSRLGHHQESLPLLEEVLQTSRETFGSEDPLTADRMGNLAVCYWYLGRMEECAELFRESYELARRLLGEHDPDVAHKAENLGIVYTAIGRLDEAEAMLEDAYDVHVAVSGPDGVEALRSRSTIATIQFERGDMATALATYEEIVPKLTEVQGAAGQQTIEAAYNLCLTYRAVDRNDDAEPLLAQYVEICGETLGTDHDQTMVFVQELAALYIETERVDQARPLVEGIVAARQAAAAKPDASAKELHDCALILLQAEPIDLRDPASALELATRANEMAEHADPEFLGTLAEALHATGDTNGAIEMLDKALAMLDEDAPKRADLERLRDEYRSN